MTARVSVLLLLCLCLSGPVLAAELEMGKDKDGTVTLKQKREPKPVPAPVQSEPGEVQGPPPNPAPGKAPDASKKPGGPPSDVSIEAKRAAIEDLNTLVTGYNERVKSLQEESDEKYKTYTRSMQRLKERKESVEAALGNRPKTVYANSPEASRWKALAEEYNELYEEQRRLNANWNDTSASLQRRSKAEDEKLAAERAKILKKYNLKESDLQ